MKLFFLAIFFFFFYFSSNAIKVLDIKVNLDTSKFGVKNYFAIDLTLIGKRGNNYLLNRNDGDFKWDKIRVKGKHIQFFNQGVIVFNQKEITEFNNEIQFEISYKDSTYFTQKIKLPYVKSLQIINEKIILNSDNNHFDYLLVFNNGKIQKPSPELFDLKDVYSVNSEIELSNGIFNIKNTNTLNINKLELVLKNKHSNLIIATKSLKIGYIDNVIIESNGRSGRNGNNGNSSNKISDNGGDGSNGENGEAAIPIDVFAKIVKKDSLNLVLIYVKLKDGRSQNHIIELNDNTKISIYAKGGSGGKGGNGGNGGPGNVESPKGGNGGLGGNGGFGGKGANVNVYLDEFSEELKTKIEINNEGGTAGSAGDGGRRGSGETTGGLLSIILNPNSGDNGGKGQYGQSSPIEFNKNIQVVPSSEWDKLLSQFR